jgi:citrate synthase
MSQPPNYGFIFETIFDISTHIFNLTDFIKHIQNFLTMSFGEEPDDDIVKLFDACLILHAEHTINASTFSAMVTASTLANPFASVSAVLFQSA